MTERILLVCSCCALLQLIDASILTAQRPPPVRSITLEEPPPTSSLERRLNEPFRINASCATLPDLVGRIRAMGIQCRVDHVALSNDGHAPGMRLHPSETRTERLRDALGQLLTPEDLTYSVGPNTLTITTVEGLEERPQIVIYDTTAIVPDGYSDGLINSLTAAIAPDTWEEVGGPGVVTASTVHGRTLITVRQDEHTQRRVASYLRAVQRAASGDRASARQTASRTSGDRLPRTNLRRSRLPKGS